MRPQIRPSIGGVPQLNTAGGSIDTADLGVTLMHEHVFVLSPEITDNYPDVWGDEAKREADAIARLNELKSRGVDSIVDLTVIGLGRYIPRIARIAAETDINIVVASSAPPTNPVSPRASSGCCAPSPRRTAGPASRSPPIPTPRPAAD
jgi:phosphotriesterase-related protein